MPRLVDLGVLIIIPAILLGVYGLPASVRNDLVLSYADPTLLTAFTAHFVHFDPMHLVTNLAAYGLVVPIAYLLCVQSGRRAEFLVAFATFILVFPLVLSALNVALVRPRVGYGFSGIATAFFGFLPIALFAYLSTQLDADVRPRDSPGVFFGTASVVTVLAVPVSRVTAIVAFAGALIAFVYVWEWIPSAEVVHRRWRAVWRERTDRAGVGVLAVGVVALFPLIAIPTDPASGGEIVNTYVHLLGYALGFIASYVTFALVGIDPAV